MNSEKMFYTDHWFDSTFVLLNESYQLDLRRIISNDIHQLIDQLSDFYMYDSTALLVHLLGLTSYYLSKTSLIYADNQLQHKLNLDLLLIARNGYERTLLVEHIKQAMSNIQSIRERGTCFDYHHYQLSSNIFCEHDKSISLSNRFCLSDNFDQHEQHSSTMMSTSNGDFIRKLLNKNERNINMNCLMIFFSTKSRLYSQRLKTFDFNRYPSLEHWIIVINCLSSNNIDFFFEQTQTNQFICDYFDKLSLKSKSLENDHPCLSTRYLLAQEHVLHLSALLHTLQMTMEILFVYRHRFHTFGQADKTFFDNINLIIEQTRSLNNSNRVYINCSIVQSAIYLVDMCLIQFEKMFEPLFNIRTSSLDDGFVFDDSNVPRNSSSPLVKRLKTTINSSYKRSLELAHELLLFPFVAFTRTSVYTNSKIKRFAIYLDSVLEELQKSHLIFSIRQGVQMIDGTRRRVDLLVKYAPHINNNETCDKKLMERLDRFNVNYDQYILTLRTLDISEKYRLSERCFSLLNSMDYQRYLKVDIQRFAPVRRIQFEEEQHEEDDEKEINELWKRMTPKIERIDSDT